MRVCILGSGLTALTLAKALVNQNIFVDLISSNRNHKINHSRTIGISKSNFNYFNRNITNIEKISWKLKKIEIYTDKNKDEKWFVKPKDGMMILFPSKLEHCVEINKSCDTRISLSFNLYTFPIKVNEAGNAYSSKKFFS